MKKNQKDPQDTQQTVQSKAWAVMLQNIQEKIDSGAYTKSSIARLLGVGRSKISGWLYGPLTGERTPIDKMRFYFERLGLNGEPFFGSGHSCTTQEVLQLRKENEALTRERNALLLANRALNKNVELLSAEVEKMKKQQKGVQPASTTAKPDRKKTGVS